MTKLMHVTYQDICTIYFRIIAAKGKLKQRSKCELSQQSRLHPDDHQHSLLVWSIGCQDAGKLNRAGTHDSNAEKMRDILGSNNVLEL